MQSLSTVLTFNSYFHTIDDQHDLCTFKLMKFTDKVVWVTGASSGIGEALAIELSKHGARLVLSARNHEALSRVKDNCSQPEMVELIPMDLNAVDSFNGMVELVISKQGHIDYLVNNAGISQRSLALETERAVDERLMRVNFLGTVALTKAVLHHMIGRQDGKIVTVSSMVGKYGTPKRSSYAASKHALHGFMDSLRAEVYKEGVKVQLICPGFVKTNISINALTASGEPQGTMDKATASGIEPDVFARKMARAMLNEREEVYICGLKELLGLYVKRFAPGLFSGLVRRISVT